MTYIDLGGYNVGYMVTLHVLIRIDMYSYRLTQDIKYGIVIT